MKDGILKETKNSRLLKAELPATYAELVALAANAGIPADVLFNAEGWQQIPTFLSKKNLLQDSTAGLLGLAGDPTVDDAFVALLLVSTQLGAVRAMVTVDGTPAKAGIEVTGIKGLDGNAVYTDSAGIAVGFAEPGEIALSTPVYQDLPSAPVIQQQVQVGEIVTVTLTIPSAAQAGTRTITATTSNIRFSPYVTGVDVCCVGAGGGGGIRYSPDPPDSGGAGGGGGLVTNSNDMAPDPKASYTAVIGAGGTGGKANGTNSPTAATSGGDSSFMGVTAKGGTSGGAYSPGTGNGNGGTPASLGVQATNGGDGTGRAFNDPDGDLFSGGGGGSPTGAGGAPYGGGAATGDSHKGYYEFGGSGSGPGGAGAGGLTSNIYSSKGAGGNGYRGEVRYRWRVA